MIMPGAFGRILMMAEKEQDSKIGLDRDSQDTVIHSKRTISKSVLRGQIFGFVSVVMFFTILGLTVWFENTAMFCVVFTAGAIAGLPDHIWIVTEMAGENKGRFLFSCCTIKRCRLYPQRFLFERIELLLRDGSEVEQLFHLFDFVHRRSRHRRCVWRSQPLARRGID